MVPLSLSRSMGCARLALLLALGACFAVTAGGCASMPDEPYMVSSTKPAKAPARTAVRGAPVPVPSPSAYQSFGMMVGVGY